MGYFSLPTGKLLQKTKKKRLKNFPAGYIGRFYRNLGDIVDNFWGSEFYARIVNDFDIPSDDVQKSFLATIDFVKGMQTDINHYVTKDKINKASFSQKLDTTSKSIIRKQNPVEFVFEDISTLNVENPIVSSLRRELEVGKKDVASDLVKKPQRPPVLDTTHFNILNQLFDQVILLFHQHHQHNHLYLKILIFLGQHQGHHLIIYMVLKHKH